VGWARPGAHNGFCSGKQVADENAPPAHRARGTPMVIDLAHEKSFPLDVCHELSLLGFLPVFGEKKLYLPPDSVT
jgi:hypothetical protein